MKLKTTYSSKAACRVVRQGPAIISKQGHLSVPGVSSEKEVTDMPAGHTMEAGEALCEIAETSPDLALKDRGLMPISLLHRLGIACRLICERYRQRRQLLEMDDRQLKDIGITPEEAELEARKPIWKD